MMIGQPSTFSIKPNIGLATIFSPYELGSADNARTLHKKAAETLTNTGLGIFLGDALVDSDEVGLQVAREFSRQELDAICVLYATYANDTFATSIIEQSDLPVIVWGTNEFDTGSIAGAQQLSAVLSETGRYYKLVFGNIDDERVIREVSRIARVSAAKRKLRQSRVGVLGYQRIGGQTQAAFDEIELHQKLGGRIVGVSTQLFHTLMEQADEKEARRFWQEVSKGVGRISVNDQQILEGVKAYMALNRIVQEKKLNAIAIEDWFDIIGIPNLGFSLLNEVGIPAGCEADVHSTLTLYLLAMLTGRPSFHGELLGILEEEDALLIAHYGAGPPSLAISRDQISLEPDRSPTGRGVSVVYQIKPGRVTVASLTGRRGTYRMLIAAGENIEARHVFHGGIVANVRFGVPCRTALEKARGMSHHWMLGMGDVSTELTEFCNMTGIRPVII
jgi:L-fucose isomerase-like protein